MRLIFQSKFGRDFQAKLEPILVASGDTVFDHLDRCRDSEETKSWRYRHSISDDKIIVIVGGSALPSGRHHETVKEIDRLSKDIKEALHFVFPLTYGAHDSNYIPSLKQAVESAQLHATYFEEFLPDSAVAAMRLNADISIKTPHYDALSLALCEDIYAGTIPIVGTWLPYGPLRSNRVYMVEIETLDQLPTQLESLHKGWKDHRILAQHNSKNIAQLLSQINRTDDWKELYLEICQ